MLPPAVLKGPLLPSLTSLTFGAPLLLKSKYVYCSLAVAVVGGLLEAADLAAARTPNPCTGAHPQ